MVEADDQSSRHPHRGKCRMVYRDFLDQCLTRYIPQSDGPVAARGSQQEFSVLEIDHGHRIDRTAVACTPGSSHAQIASTTPSIRLA
ncbi:hypothetical protein [Streptomyces sp. NPDC060022]|uniref:hypothetical protein n=1 Tax=Streptomyces sp. NPDC060022 TaxID=3347039 RepID=UPI0036A6891B